MGPESPTLSLAAGSRPPRTGPHDERSLRGSLSVVTTTRRLAADGRLHDRHPTRPPRRGSGGRNGLASATLESQRNLATPDPVRPLTNRFHRFGRFLFDVLDLQRHAVVVPEFVPMAIQEIPVQRRERARVFTDRFVRLVPTALAMIAHPFDVLAGRAVRLR